MTHKNYSTRVIDPNEGTFNLCTGNMSNSFSLTPKTEGITPCHQKIQNCIASRLFTTKGIAPRRLSRWQRCTRISYSAPNTQRCVNGWKVLRRLCNLKLNSSFFFMAVTFSGQEAFIKKIKAAIYCFLARLILGQTAHEGFVKLKGNHFRRARFNCNIRHICLLLVLCRNRTIAGCVSVVESQPSLLHRGFHHA